MTRIQGNILNVYTYNTGDFLANDVSAGSTDLPLLFAFDFNEAGGEAIVTTTSQVIIYTGFDPDTQVLHLDASTPLDTSEEAGTKIEVLPYTIEKRAVIDDGEGNEPYEARVPHNLQAVLEDGIRSEESGYESVSIEQDGSEWVLREIYGKPAIINADALPNIPVELVSDGLPPVSSPSVAVTPLGVGALQARWLPVEQPDAHDPIIYDVYVSATTPVVADADSFLTSVAGTSASFSRVRVGGVDVPISLTEPSYVAVWARDTDGFAPSLGGEGSGIPRKADIDELNVGQIHAEAIEAFRIYAAQIDTDFVFVSDKIQIGNPAASHIDIDPEVGLVLYGTNGTTPVVTLDMTDAQLSEFTGKINTDKLAVFDSLEISGLLSRIMSAALLTIASSTINPPSSEPTLSQSTNTQNWIAPPSGFTETGLWWDGTYWYRLLYNNTTFVSKVQRIDATPEVTAEVTLQMESTDRDTRGLVYQGGYLYTIARNNAAAGSGGFYLKKFDFTGVAVPDTSATVVLTYNNKYGFLSRYIGDTVYDVRIDASNILHLIDADMVRRFTTSGTYLGQTVLPATAQSSFDVDSSGNYYVWDLNGSTKSIIKVDPSGTILLQFGSTGSGDGQFSASTGIGGIRVDGSGNIYVADTGNHRIQKFNSSGVYQSQFGTQGTGNGQFTSPFSVNFDSSGNIYVADFSNHRIQKFNSSGTYQSQFGGPGTGGGLFDGPLDIDFDTSGNIYVADSGNDIVQKFNSAGVYQSEFGFADHEEAPVSLALDSSDNVYTAEAAGDEDANWVNKFNSSGVYQGRFSNHGGTTGDAGMDSPNGVAIDSGGNIWIADTNYNRIKKFNSSGVWQADYGTQGTGNGQFSRPSAIAIDTSDNIYIADTWNHRIQKFNSSMTWQWSKGSATVGEAGSGNGEFHTPEGIAVDPAGNVYVADSSNDRVQKLNTSGAYQTKWGTLGTANGQFDHPVGIAADSTHVYVVDRNNSRIQKFSNTGTYVAKTGTYGSGNTNFAYPQGITLDGAGNLHISDLDNYRIKKYTSALVYQSEIDAGVVEPDNWFHARDVAFDSSGSMYLIDSYSSKIYKYIGTYPPLKRLVATELSPTIRVQPTLGVTTTDLVVGGLDITNLDMANGTNAGFYRYSLTDLSFNTLATLAAGNISSGQTATYVGIGTYDYGASRAVIASASTVRVYTISGTALTADTTYPTWTTDGSIKAMDWNGTNFYSTSDGTVLRRYSGFLGTNSNRKFWVQYQWEDAAGTTGTLPSPTTADFTLSDRRWLNVTVPAPAAGTNNTRIFLGNSSTGGGYPGNSNMWRRGGALTTAATVQYATIDTSSGVNPRTTHTIASGAAGRFEAAAGTFKVDGNSVGTWHEKEATPRFYGNLTANESTTTDVAEPILWTEVSAQSSDASGYYSYNSGTGELTFLKTGWWRLYAQVIWNATTETTSSVQMWADMSGTIIAHDRQGASFRVTNKISTTYYFTAGQIVTMQVEQSTGTVVIRGADPGACYFSAVYEGPAL